jgi:hypothetical protein
MGNAVSLKKWTLFFRNENRKSNSRFLIEHYYINYSIFISNCRNGDYFEKGLIDSAGGIAVMLGAELGTCSDTY